MKTEIKMENVHDCHTFNQLCFAVDCSYLHPQMFLKDESSFLEIPQSGFVCFMLRLNY